MWTTDLGSIHGIPSGDPELTDLMTCLSEKMDEESIRSIWKGETQACRTPETDVDFDNEHKTLNDKIRSLENERVHLEQICHSNRVDTHTRKENERDKVTDKSRDTTRHIRNDEVNKVDTTCSEIDLVDNDTDLTTSI